MIKSSRAIGRVRCTLYTDVSMSISVIIIRVDVLFLAQMVIIIRCQNERYMKILHTAMLLSYFLQKKTCRWNLYTFRRYIIMHHFRTLHCVELLSLPSREFIRPPCNYKWLQKIEKYEVRVASSSKRLMQNFVKIDQLVSNSYSTVLAVDVSVQCHQGNFGG
jgi:hypothetical protein